MRTVTVCNDSFIGSGRIMIKLDSDPCLCAAIVSPPKCVRIVVNSAVR